MADTTRDYPGINPEARQLAVAFADAACATFAPSRHRNAGRRTSGASTRCVKCGKPQSQHWLRQALSDDPGRRCDTGSGRIATERLRQCVQEGWTPEHDDSHHRGELVTAAMCYAIHASFAARGQVAPVALCASRWPWTPSSWKPSGDPIRDLEKAGALIAAEIDRLERRSPGCILDVDSPSYPPNDDERQQCGCKLCLQGMLRAAPLQAETLRSELAEAKREACTDANGLLIPDEMPVADNIRRLRGEAETLRAQLAQQLARQAGPVVVEPHEGKDAESGASAQTPNPLADGPSTDQPNAAPLMEKNRHGLRPINQERDTMTLPHNPDTSLRLPMHTRVTLGGIPMVLRHEVTVTVHEDNVEMIRAELEKQGGLALHV